MSDVIDFDANETQEAAQQAVAPAVNPTEVAREVARILHGGHRVSQQPVQQQSALEGEIQNLVNQGYNAEALQVIARIRAAERNDEARQAYAQQYNIALQAAQKETWDTAKEEFDAFAERLPALAEAESSVLQRFHAIFDGDPEYRNEILKVTQGQKASRLAIRKAMGKAIDVFCQKTGIEKPAGPMSLSTSKPVQPGITRSGYDNLDHNQKKLYNALKGTLGEDKALTRAKEMYSD